MRDRVRAAVWTARRARTGYRKVPAGCARVGAPATATEPLGAAMRTKATFLAGFATGYVLGARPAAPATSRSARPPGPSGQPRRAVDDLDRCSTRPGTPSSTAKDKAAGRLGDQLARRRRPGSARGTEHSTDGGGVAPTASQRLTGLTRGTGARGWPGCAASTAPARASPGCGAAGASPTAIADGSKVTDPVVLERIAGLVLPPAWDDVWICPHPQRAHPGCSAPTRPAAGSTATTTSGASSATPRSTSGC